MAHDPDLQAVLSRLEKLERESGRMKRIAAAAVLALAAVALMGQAQAPARPRVVEAEKFVVRSPDGQVWAELGADVGDDHAEKAALRLFDRHGKARVDLTVVSSGSRRVLPSLKLFGREPGDEASLAMFNDGSSGLGLSTASEGGRRLTLTGGRWPALTLHDDHGAPRAVLQLVPDQGHPRLRLTTRHGAGIRSAPLASLELGVSDHPSLTLGARREAHLVLSLSSEDGSPRLGLRSDSELRERELLVQDGALQVRER